MLLDGTNNIPVLHAISEGKFSKALTVVDMQYGFTGYLIKTGDYPAITKLQQNICGAIHQTLEEGGVIINILFLGHGGPDEEIGKILDKNKNKVIRINKRQNGLFGELNSGIDNKRNNGLLRGLKRANIPVQLSGVNTCGCILRLQAEFARHEISLSIPLGTTLNSRHTGKEEENTLDFVKWEYWDKDFDKLFGTGLNLDSYLTDYL